MKTPTDHKDSLPPSDELIPKLKHVNDLLWKEVRKVPKLRKRMHQYPEFHIVSGVLLRSVECCALEFRLSRDEDAYRNSDGLPKTVNHFLRLPERVHRELLETIESLGIVDYQDGIGLPLKIGGIEAYDSPNRTHHKAHAA